jgi:hypothetical protein
VVDVIEKSDALDKQIAGSDAIRHLEKSGRRSWLAISLLIPSLALDIILSVAVGVLAFRDHELVQQANSLQQRAYATCIANNETHKDQVTLWEYLFALPPTTPRTAAEERQIEHIRVFIRDLFKPRQCS